MKRSDFYYDLPEELIAQTPIANRDQSRLLKMDRETGEISHHRFSEIAEYLQPGDVLVLNDSRVIPARLFGVREDTGGAIEFVLLRRVQDDQWEVILKPGRRAKPGVFFSFGEGRLRAEILEILDQGIRLVKFHYSGIFEEVLEEIGNVPLPPYIHEQLEDKERYQTVYARNPGSAAAPTAGLHFTPELLKKLEDQGISIAKLTLHVGLGTFRPVKAENIEEHQMHSELYHVSEETAQKINEGRARGGRIVAVGTTSCRTLESVADEAGVVHPGYGSTDIFIYPGYRFKIMDALITNFHLPESTLLMLVSAFAGKEHILHAYEVAIQERYRFFSFGDAMLLM